MADEYAKLLAQQQGIGYSPRENIYGQIGGTIASALPQLVRPYASSSSNIATVLGGSLLAGLLGYQAKQEAAAQNELLMPALTNIVGARTRADLDTATTDLAPDIATRLAPITLRQLGTIQEREQAQIEAQAEEARKMRIFEQQQDIIQEGRKDLEELKQNNRKEQLQLQNELKQLKNNEGQKLTQGDRKMLTDLGQFGNAMIDITNAFEQLEPAEIKLITQLGINPSEWGLVSRISAENMRVYNNLKQKDVFKGLQTKYQLAKQIFRKKEFGSQFTAVEKPELQKIFGERYRQTKAETIAGLRELATDSFTKADLLLETLNVPPTEIRRKLQNAIETGGKYIPKSMTTNEEPTPTVATSVTQAGNATPTAEQLAQAKSILNDPNESEEYKNEIRQVFGL